MNATENIVDDNGTTQAAARKMLTEFCRNGFADNLEQAALALGRPPEELTDFISGEQVIDDDLVMKMRGIAQQRAIELE